MIFACRANLTQYFCIAWLGRESHWPKLILLRDVFTLPSKIRAALTAGVREH
jgi:hypothetical protein